MSTTPAGWYDDPTLSGRLRYWDGEAWTEWVHDGGATTSVPVGGEPALRTGARDEPAPVPSTGPTPTAGAPTVTGQPVVEPTPGIIPAPAPSADPPWGAPAAETAPPPAAQGLRARLLGRDARHPRHPVGRVAHLVAAAGGAVALLASGRVLTFQGGGFVSVTFTADLAVTAVALALLAGALVAAVARPVWVRLAGHAVAAVATVLLLAVMLATRTSDDLVPGVDVQVRGGWWLVAAGALLGLVGVLVASAWFVTRPAADDGRSGAPAFAVTGFVVALLGVLLPPLGAPGAAMGALGRCDADASSGRIGSRGLAVAAFVIGLVMFILWGGGLYIAGLVAQP